MPLDHAVLHVDGASRGNPGPSGVGVVLADPEGAVLHEVAENIGRTTNNVAEYTAWIRGLSLAADFGARQVTIHSDSELIIRQLKGDYQVKQPHLRGLHAEVKRLFNRFERVRVRQIPREQNADADLLATGAVRGEIDPEGRSVVDFERPRKAPLQLRAAP
ncbi:MAG: ribonuclease H [Armatimonadetes bacterium CG_4_10_14_3_um_filter_66_18]|nr:MAG: ribonuclease H [Armatimonadetes bacterium CG_4_10_14_3_um_filter_66_18]